MKNITTLCFLFLAFLSVAQENTYEYESSGFKAFFPEKPAEQSQEAPTEVGNIKVNMFMYQGTDEMFMISENQYPDGLVNLEDNEANKPMLKGALNGSYNSMAAQSEATVNMEYSEYFIFNEKYQGIKGKATIGTLYIESFVVINGNKMYQVMCIGMGKYAVSENAKKFLNSFEIIKSK